jgi:enoyl-CoA hydratase/carnithine racemase
MSGNIRVEVLDGHVALITMTRPPHNFLTASQISDIADALHSWEGDPLVRAAVLTHEGRSFCAGAQFGDEPRGDEPRGDEPTETSANSGGGERVELSATEDLYGAAARLAEAVTPWVAAIRGPVIGGGLGLAMLAAQRVACPEARFSANFAKLGIHQGFGLSVTLPELLGPAKAAHVLLTGRRFTGEQAVELGLADRCVPEDCVVDEALALAREIAENAPLALEAINRTLRTGLAERIRIATAHEAAEQKWLAATDDAREGVLSVAERRPGRFAGK